MLFPENESQRLEVLHQYQILDTPPEVVFDGLAQLAANFCQTPIALITLVDAEREWFKSKIGVTTSQVPRNISFGSYTIWESQILIIPDTLEDERFATNPLITSNNGFRFYAGVPLITSDGFALGTLCVLDFVVRNLNNKEQVTLQNLAQQIIIHLDLHRSKIMDDSQKSFNLLFSKNPNSMWVFDEHSLRFLDVNEAAIVHYGYSREEFLQMRITDISPPEDVPIVLEYLAEKPMLHFCGQWQHRRKNGQMLDVEIVSHKIDYANHQAQLVNIKDISEHKRIEKNLQDSEARFQAISEAIPVPLIISRVSDGLILYANAELIKTFQFSQTNLINQKYLLDLYHDLADLTALLQALNQYDSIRNYELQLKRADGTSFWAIASLQYVNFNNEAAILTVFNDINDRKNIETKLQEKNEFLRLIFENMPLMIALINPNGELQWVNQEWESVLGWKLQDFKNSDVLEVLYPNPEYRQYVVNFIQSARRKWGDFRIQMRDGNLLDTSWTNVNLPNGQIIGIGQDITERKRTELAIIAQAEREQLMRTVAQRIRQSLNLQDILNATVEEVRDLLKVERVVVYQFDREMIGTIMAESVEPGWTVSLGVEIHDTCFQQGAGIEYYQGRKRANANIYNAGLSECHIQLLERFDVKANLVVPILLEVNSQNPGSHLWGLLIAHQCSRFREWEENQLDLLDGVTVQLAIAIQQSSIFEQAQTELIQRQKVEVKLRSALAEKEVLLKEVHHRVKNNLQIVSSLLQLQSHTIKDPEVIKVLRESQNRIESISLIHKNLYTSTNIGKIDIGEYINNLATSLLISYQIVPGRITLETDIDSVCLNIDQAIACGLVINELISNALKHAFPNQQAGRIQITLRNLNNIIEMTIQDNGIGLPDNLDWRNTDSLGLSLVYDLVTEQLEGEITLERDGGTVFKIQFTQLTLD
ncbi:MAG: PAS domain S-box protein [Nostoc sp. ZfuVER08]|jgi:PAS domain S-box-containing protein|uniref:PAS domain S-box protein n=1 Tax=Nostoc punctiforme FACHB-252 TaxID=1357509 RepID=A0ABR8HD52_NOSPU|nr:PAS domain S-box protein [Nostoc punctiforme]MBD2613018.1 PAS domain S-box protein [Nostoc punctiforme FACHB-252]MBL1203081.1 PAS domain S-box protein [Nostoc sp. GBBB01]MDZ8011686.1 PAS domain S-box protein [Nostoc sp. ZfuVER08]